MNRSVAELVRLLLILLVAFPSNAASLRCEGYVTRVKDYESLDKAARILEADLRELRDLRNIENREQRTEARENIYVPEKASLVARGAVIANYAFSMLLAYQVAKGYVADPKTVFASLVTVPSAMFSASAVSWFFHKSLDSFMSEANPIWGQSVRNFRKHHEYATGHNKDTYVNHISDIAKVLLPAFAAAPFIKMDPAMGAATWVFLVSLLNAAEVHRQAHLGAKANKVFLTLQKMGLAIGQKAHNRHHKDPFNTDFDILFGWSNKPFEKLNLSERLNFIFYKWMKRFRRMPNDWIHSPGAIPPEVIREIISDLHKGVDHVPRSLWVVVDHVELMARSRGQTSRLPKEVLQIVEMSKALERAQKQYRLAN